MDGLSVAQSGVHLLLQIQESPTGLGKYLRRMLSEPSNEVVDERQRSLLPLPLKKDVAEAVKVMMDKKEYRRLAGTWKDKRAAGTSKVQREMRKQGLMAWHCAVTLGLNYLWSSCRSGGRVCHRKPSRAQELCQERIWQAVRHFIDDVSEVKEKLVKAPERTLWEGKLDGVKISYQGEIVEKAQPLTLDQIISGLPPSGFGGKVALADLCEGETKRLLLNPEETLLSGEDLPQELPKPRVLASDQEWDLIGKELYDRGLAGPVARCAAVGEQKILNGAFGVLKPGKLSPKGAPVLRLIMDFRAVNSVMRVIEGDVRTLVGAPALQHVVLPEGHVLRVSAEDLVSAFYLFSLPEAWSHLMCFERVIKWRSLGVDKDGETYLGASVLPMGWSSAVGLMQHAHRRLALRSPFQGGGGLLGELEIRKDTIFPELEPDGNAAWSLYLDDTAVLEILSEKIAKEVEGKPGAEQTQLRQAYTHWGIPFSKDKALTRAKEAEKLGSVIKGDLGHLRVATRRSLDSIAMAAWLFEKEFAPKKALQVYAGKEVHTLQFRRPLFCIFDWLWKEIGSQSNMVRMEPKVIEEMLLVGCMQAMKFTDLRATLNGVVTASDACETGGGACYANQLSMQGIADVLAVEEGFLEMDKIPATLDKAEKVVVIDFFAGIGGLSRAMELARIRVNHLVVVESDANCRRLHRRRWPGCELIGDIKKVTKERLEKEIRKVTDVTGVVAGGGSPCQGLSKLSVFRQHLDDPRSALFYDLAQCLSWIQEIAIDMGIWAVRFCENVVGDEEDIQRMSKALGMDAIEACASDISRVRRPRLYWSSCGLDDHGSYRREDGARGDVMRLIGPVEPLEAIPDEGWGWPGGEIDGDLKIPTFTRAIPRVRAPPAPAGIASCSAETLEEWRMDKMKFPPYTYQPQYLFRHCETGATRVASSGEREVLMGFRRGYTLALFKKKPETEKEEEEQEVARQAALGNSFHCIVMAVLLDLWLWTRKVRTEPVGTQAILASWHEELLEKSPAQFAASDGEDAGRLPEESESEHLALVSEKRMRAPYWIRPEEDWPEGEDMKSMTQRIVHHYLKRMEFRGSDVRLDLGMFYRPDVAPRTSIDPSRWSWSVAHSYPFRQAEHINVLELRAILHTLEWRARTATFHSCRFLHLSDSQVCLSVLNKGRSSSRKLNRLLRRISALCLALNVLPLWAWVESRLNPADEPSRRFDAPTH